MQKTGKKTGYEKLGLSLSLLCGIHCLLMPVAFTVMPFTASSFFADPLTEWLIIIPGLMISGFFLWNDYRNKHGKMLPLAIFSFAAFSILAGHLFVEHSHTEASFITPAAAVLLCGAYLLNWRTNRQYKSCAH